MTEEVSSPQSMHFEEQIYLGTPPTPNKALFHRHAVQFEAVKFTGDNFEEIQIFNPIGTYLIPEEINQGALAELWDDDANRWIPVYTNEWIVQQDEGWVKVTSTWLELNCVQLDETTLEFLREQQRPKSLEHELASLLNYHSAENESGTPQFILAGFLMGVLKAYNDTLGRRAAWRGESVELPALQRLREEGRSKEVPVVMYEHGRKNEIGTAKVKITPGEVGVEGTINAVIPIFTQTSLHPDVPIEESKDAQVFVDLNTGQEVEAPRDAPIEEQPASGPFVRYQQKGLSENG